MIQQEEVTIYDIANVLRKHKMLYWSVFMFVLLIGVLAIMSLPERYQYTQTIKIANYFDGNKLVELVDTADKTGALIQLADINLAVNNYNLKHPDSLAHAGSDAIIVDYSGNAKLALIGKGTSADKDFYEEVFRNILQQIATLTDSNYRATKNALSS